MGEGANQTISGTAMDKAGNSASTSITHVNVDVTAPTINSDESASDSYLLNQSANASYGCNDTGSSGLLAGSAVCGGPVASGSQFDTASVGSKNFTVNTKDVAGNTASQTNAYGAFYSTGAYLGSACHYDPAAHQLHRRPCLRQEARKLGASEVPGVRCERRFDWNAGCGHRLTNLADTCRHNG